MSLFGKEVLGHRSRPRRLSWTPSSDCDSTNLIIIRHEIFPLYMQVCVVYSTVQISCLWCFFITRFIIFRLDDSSLSRDVFIQHFKEMVLIKPPHWGICIIQSDLDIASVEIFQCFEQHKQEVCSSSSDGSFIETYLETLAWLDVIINEKKEWKRYFLHAENKEMYYLNK